MSGSVCDSKAEPIVDSSACLPYPTNPSFLPKTLLLLDWMLNWHRSRQRVIMNQWATLAVFCSGLNVVTRPVIEIFWL